MALKRLRDEILKKGGKEAGKLFKKGEKFLDDLLTPKQLAAKQKEQSRRTRRKLKEKEDPLKSFAGSKDPAIKKARQEAIDKARAQAKKTRGAQKRRQQKEKDAAVSKRKKQIGGAGAGTAAVIGLTTLGSNDKPKPKPKSKTLKTTDQMKKDRQAVSDIAKFSAKKNQEKLDKEKRRKEDSAKDLTWKDFSGRGALKRAKEYGLKHYMGADGKKKATIDKSEIREGETMTEAFNRILGKKPRKKNMGGMMKSKMSSKGGTMGGKMARGMKGGGMMKSKMSSKGGKMGGKMVRGYKDGDEVKKTENKKVRYVLKERKDKDKPSGSQGGKPVPKNNKGLSKLPKDVRNKMGYMNKGGMAKKGYSKGGAVKKKSKPRGVGVALRGYGKAMR